MEKKTSRSSSSGSARKRPAKKSRAVTRSAQARPAVLADAPPGKGFWVNFGPILNNLRDLREALAGEITDAQFAYHVGPGHNDFAAWVADVLGDQECAKALRRVRKRQSALKAVDTCLAARG